MTEHLPEESAPGTSEQVLRGLGGVGKIPAVQYAHWHLDAPTPCCLCSTSHFY